jgi:hypothetical protein
MPTQKLHCKSYIVVVLAYWSVRWLRFAHDLPRFIRFLIRGI